MPRQRLAFQVIGHLSWALQNHLFMIWIRFSFFHNEFKLHHIYQKKFYGSKSTSEFFLLQNKDLNLQKFNEIITGDARLLFTCSSSQAKSSEKEIRVLNRDEFKKINHCILFVPRLVTIYLTYSFINLAGEIYKRICRGILSNIADSQLSKAQLGPSTNQSKRNDYDMLQPLHCCLHIQYLICLGSWGSLRLCSICNNMNPKQRRHDNDS